MPTKKTAGGSTPTKRGRKPTAMTGEHKAALAAGRDASRAVRNYLEALESHKPKRGRRRTPESVSARLAVVEEAVADAAPMSRLALLQEQIDLKVELAAFSPTVDLTALEAAFIESAWTYGQNKGISYGAWRAIGVSPEVLRQTGITRSNS